MIIEKNEFSNKTDLLSFLNRKEFKKFTGYELKPNQKVQEIIDHENKKGPIKSIIFLR